MDDRKYVRALLTWGAVLLLVVLAGIGAWGWANRPKVYRTLKSPDEKWSVSLIRKASWFYPVVMDVQVWAEIRDRSGKLLTRRSLQGVDMWGDVEREHYVATCTNEAVVLGPVGWTVDKPVYARVERSQFEHQ